MLRRPPVAVCRVCGRGHRSLFTLSSQSVCTDVISCVRRYKRRVRRRMRREPSFREWLHRGPFTDREPPAR
jgi:hypothetical protein